MKTIIFFNSNTENEIIKLKELITFSFEDIFHANWNILNHIYEPLEEQLLAHQPK